MASAKDLQVKPIASRDAIAFVKAHHYSGKVTQNSQLHLGVFLHDRLHGVMQFGPSLDKRKIQGLVAGTLWHEFLELNRMAFDDVLPRNSESRALAIAWRLLRKHAPQVKWVVSFADATQCGDGTIYRAAGFVLTGIKANAQILQMPDGKLIAKKTLDNPNHMTDAGRFGSSLARQQGARALYGFQLRYMYFIDPTYRARLTVPELPYSKITDMGARMYKGQRITSGRGETDNAPHSNAATEGASPIRPLLKTL